jgi:hypothetical protein
MKSLNSNAFLWTPMELQGIHVDANSFLWHPVEVL